MLEEALRGAFEALARMPPNPKFAGADQGHAGRGASDAANLAVRAHAVDAKTAVEHEKNVITAARLAGDQQLKGMKLATQAADERAELAISDSKTLPNVPERAACPNGRGRRRTRR
jgi:hypothetical protein